MCVEETFLPPNLHVFERIKKIYVIFCSYTSHVLLLNLMLYLRMSALDSETLELTDII